MEDGKMLISVSEAAKRLGLGPERTYALVKSGELKSVPNGKRNRKVPVIALEEYVRTSMNGGMK